MQDLNSGSSRRICLLGGLQIHDAHGSRRLSGEKVQSLLACLLLHPRHPVRREMLADLVWCKYFIQSGLMTNKPN